MFHFWPDYKFLKKEMRDNKAIGRDESLIVIWMAYPYQSIPVRWNNKFKKVNYRCFSSTDKTIYFDNNLHPEKIYFGFEINPGVRSSSPLEYQIDKLNDDEYLFSVAAMMERQVAALIENYEFFRKLPYENKKTTLDAIIKGVSPVEQLDILGWLVRYLGDDSHD